MRSNSDGGERTAALDAFYRRYRINALVLDKWFSVQALSTRDDKAAMVETLAKHGDFTLANPNRMRSLLGPFAANHRAVPDPSVRGYRSLADISLAVEKLTPQTDARPATPPGRRRAL